MSAEHGWLLVGAGIGSVLVGVAMLSVSRRRIHARRSRALGPLAGWMDALTCTSISAAVVVSVQRATDVHPGSSLLWTAAHGVPALLAGTTVARLYAAARAIRHRRRWARAFRRGIGATDD